VGLLEKMRILWVRQSNEYPKWRNRWLSWPLLISRPRCHPGLTLLAWLSLLFLCILYRNLEKDEPVKNRKHTGWQTYQKGSSE
jgi:hypothetical protein